MNYRDDDVNYLTNVDEFSAFHAYFVAHRIPHTLAIECDQLDRNHALCNWIKSNRIFDVQIHGWTHKDYSKCSEEETYQDLVRCKEFIAWKFGRQAKYFYPPWNIDGQEPRRAAARAGLVFDNHRVEARDYLAGGHGRTVNLHYWQDLSIIDGILRRETESNSLPRKEFNSLVWDLGTVLPPRPRVLMTGKTHVFDYERYFPDGEFVTIDNNPAVGPTVVGDIESPPALGEFDAVLFFGIYELLSRPLDAIRKFEAFVKPGGLLVVGAPLAERSWGKMVYAGPLEGLSQLALDVNLSRVCADDYLIGTFRK